MSNLRRIARFYKVIMLFRVNRLGGDVSTGLVLLSEMTASD